MFIRKLAGRNAMVMAQMKCMPTVVSRRSSPGLGRSKIGHTEKEIIHVRRVDAAFEQGIELIGETSFFNLLPTLI